MYQALYRKWRPKVFSEVSGQGHITETLKTQVKKGSVSHAYLFTGSRGTGKTTCAKLLARAVNCERPVGGDPCNECPSCLGIIDGSVTDVLEIDAASNSGVDNVRALREQTVYTPAQAKMRVYIIDEVHMLSAGAFNALLKTLEEPPDHVLFILATTELGKVPATILSRCQRFAFRRISNADIESRLKLIAAGEGIKLTGEACALIARISEGGLRDAVSILDQCSLAGGGSVDEPSVLSVLGLAGERGSFELALAVGEGDAGGALRTLDRLYDAGGEYAPILDELAGVLRGALLSRLGAQTGLSLTKAEIDRLSELFGEARLVACITALQEALTLIPRAYNRRMCAEMCFISLCDGHFEGQSADISPLVKRIERLEELISAQRQDRPAGKRAESISEKRMPEGPLRPEKEEIPQHPDVAEVPDVPAEEDKEGGRAFDWQGVLANVKERVPQGQFAALCKCGAALSDGLLSVFAQDEMTFRLINRKEVLDAVKVGAEGRAQGDIRVGAVLRAQKENNAGDRLDRLIGRIGGRKTD